MNAAVWGSIGVAGPLWFGARHTVCVARGGMEAGGGGGELETMPT